MATLKGNYAQQSLANLMAYILRLHQHQLEPATRLF